MSILRTYEPKLNLINPAKVILPTEKVGKEGETFGVMDEELIRMYGLLMDVCDDLEIKSSKLKSGSSNVGEHELREKEFQIQMAELEALNGVFWADAIAKFPKISSSVGPVYVFEGGKLASKPGTNPNFKIIEVRLVHVR